MTTEPETTRIVRSWLHEDEHESADRVLAQVLAELDTTPQRRSWWPAWRMPYMNTYAKLAIATVAVVIVVAAAFYLLPGRDAGAVGSPTSTAASPRVVQSPFALASVPGAFKACVPMNSELRRGTDEQVVVPHPDGDMTVARRRGFTWAGEIQATDDRFSGTHYYSFDADEYTLPSGQPGPEAFAEGHRIENDQGAWQGWAVGGGMTKDDGMSSPVYLTGEGAYQGLTAILFLDEAPGCFYSFQGLVAEFPEPPVPATSR